VTDRDLRGAELTGGRRLTLLVDEDARDELPRIRRMLEDKLPERFGEFPRL
jgi:hypothetical protein